jgi:hypothetical protein
MMTRHGRKPASPEAALQWWFPERRREKRMESLMKSEVFLKKTHVKSPLVSICVFLFTKALDGL